MSQTDVERLQIEWGKHFAAEFDCMAEAGQLLVNASKAMLASADIVPESAIPSLKETWDAISKFGNILLVIGEHNSRQAKILQELVRLKEGL